MTRAILRVLLPVLVCAPLAAQDGPTSKPQDASAPVSPQLRAVLDADEAKLTPALVALLEERLATNAIYDGQYSDLRQAGAAVVERLGKWITDPPPGVSRLVPFRRACVSALRDTVDEPSAAVKAALQEIADDEFENAQLKQAAVFALAQFGDRERADALIAAAQRKTEGDNAGQQANAWAELADHYYNLRQYDDADAAYARFFAIAEKQPNRVPTATAYYNWACSVARAGKIDRAFEILTKALEVGRQGEQLTKGLLRTDMDIAALRSDPRFPELIAKYFGGAPDKTTEKAEKSEPEKAPASDK
jgi:tetratricopeptide (TPR) repeat protein